MNFPFDGQRLWNDFFASHGDHRPDHRELHLGDISSCDYATALRIKGVPEAVPFSDDSKGRFFIGHAVEGYLAKMFAALEKHGWRVKRWGERETVSLEGVVGHIDWTLERDGVVIVIDPRTTASRSADPSESHVIKTAAYCLTIGAEWGVELVIRVAFGKVVEGRWHWFRPEDYREDVESGVARLRALKASESLPAMEPPAGETWRCRAYCEARCERNERWLKMQAEDAPIDAFTEVAV